MKPAMGEETDQLESSNKIFTMDYNKISNTMTSPLAYQLLFHFFVHTDLVTNNVDGSVQALLCILHTDNPGSEGINGHLDLLLPDQRESYHTIIRT